MDYKYDLYLAGNWEGYLRGLDRRDFHDALRGYIIYDSKDFRERNWFKQNMDAARNSKLMVTMIPEFQMSSAEIEVGVFYNEHIFDECMGFDQSLDNLIIVWPPSTRPDFGKRTLEKMGIVVNDVQKAIRLSKRYLSHE